MADDRADTERGAVARIRVSLALLAVRNSTVEIAISSGPAAAIPSCEPDPGTSLDTLARSMLTRATGSEFGYLEQLYTFSFDRPDTAEVVVSYLGLAPNESGLSEELRWNAATSLQTLSNEDRVVADYALIRLRAKIGYSTIAFHLMPESFSLSDLQQTYESILDRPLDPRNFRRRMVSSGLLQSENRLRREGSHRPAALYRFSGSHDPGSFLTPSRDRLHDEND